jgi:polar amino acid transport system permease protein
VPRRPRPRLTLARAAVSRPASVLQYALIVGLVAWLAFDGAAAMGYNWQWYRVPQYFWRTTPEGFVWGEIPRGLLATIALSGSAFALAVALGLLVAILRLSGLIVGGAVALVFLEIVRNTPLLVLLYLFYYVLGPIFGLNRVAASVLCLGVFHGALVSEIFRAGINAVARGQWEAAESIGMSRGQIYRHIILPQSVRMMLPPLTGEIVHVIKSSAIVSVIAVAELTTMGRNIISDTYMSFEIWFTVAAVYMVVTLTISILVSRLERRYAVRD